MALSETYTIFCQQISRTITGNKQHTIRAVSLLRFVYDQVIVVQSHFLKLPPHSIFSQRYNGWIGLERQ